MRAHLALAAVLCVTSGCLTSSLVTTGCDMAHTFGRSQRGYQWSYERNPILGKEPTGKAVAAYGALVMAGIVLVDKHLPQPYNAIFHGVVTATEMVTNTKNYNTNPDFCGIK